MSEENKVEQKMSNVVFVGGKPLVNYIRAVTMQFTKDGASEVTIKSRGKFISKAVDVAEIVKRTMEEKSVKIKGVRIASEKFESEGKNTNISTMDIVLSE